MKEHHHHALQQKQSYPLLVIFLGKLKVKYLKFSIFQLIFKSTLIRILKDFVEENHTSNFLLDNSNASSYL